MTEARTVLVVVPAHNEEDSIGPCLDAVAAAVGHAVQVGAIDAGRIVVAAHRCRDATSIQSTSVLASSGLAFQVVELAPAMVVGEVRNRAVAQGGDLWPPSADDWIFSTDADSMVPVDWITAMLAAADRDRAVLILGLVELDGWSVEDHIRAAYDKVVADGLTVDGHSHAYAANLAVRWDAFDRVGGFGCAEHGEERSLEHRVRAAGLAVSTPVAPRVRTSSRMPGRAAHGLGTLLASLVSSERSDHAPDPDQLRRSVGRAGAD